MKIFIINLESARDKRQQMEQQLSRAGIDDYELIDAIYGKGLSADDISKSVYDYPACALTLGEIGCALSHLKVYSLMIEKNISSAIILEDDVIIPEIFPQCLDTLKQSIEIDDTKVISLGRANKLTLRKRYSSFADSSTEYGEYTAVTAFGTYAYAINLAAAKSLLENLLPIKYEADMFIHFRENGWLKTFNIIYPQLIRIIDNHEQFSDIYLERREFKKRRHDYKKRKLLKARPIGIRLRNRVRRLIWKIKQIKPQKRDN